MDKKGPFLVKEIKTLSPGRQIWGKFLVLEKVHRKTKDGKEVTNLRVGDNTGEIDVVIWDNCEVGGEINTNIVLGIQGDLGVYNNRLQITGKRVKALEDDITPYLKGPDTDIDKLKEDFAEICNSINDPYIANLLEQIFTPIFLEVFCKSPAAKKVHHNYPGGLLEHTLQVANICHMTAKLYPKLNRDLLVAGAILHDIGKVEEYELAAVPEYTMSGRMVGHIVLGHEIIDVAIKNIRANGDNFPEFLEVMIKHMILSHHGSLEFGSPVKPLFPEALLLHMADNLDAKLFVFINKIEEDEEGESLFTPYDSFFEQYFFKYRYGELDADEM